MKRLNLLLMLGMFIGFLACSDDNGVEYAKPAFKIAADEIVIGQEKTMSIDWSSTSLDKPELVWTSADKNIATVNNSGVVRAISVGKTDIIATSKSDKNISATINITVKAVMAESISINETIPAEIYLNNTLSLTTSILPANTTNTRVVWTSSNTEVADVDEGIVTALKEGTAKITAKIDEKSVSVDIVVKKYIPVTEIMLTAPANAISNGNTHQMIFKVLPENATNQTLTWTSSNEAIITVDDKGVITSKGSGNSMITAKSADGVSKTVKVFGSPTPPPPPPPPPPGPVPGA
ncbi:MAG: Ig-like domain-containing protein [Marinifilaceae bacterium]|jgi:uncharacterized protein YjdB|nr:Ig-like domain-containing protein [Marinifilaceae bacterium]